MRSVYCSRFRPNSTVLNSGCSCASGSIQPAYMEAGKAHGWLVAGIHRCSSAHSTTHTDSRQRHPLGVPDEGQVIRLGHDDVGGVACSVHQNCGHG
jgi:hypothetical protein